MNRGAHVSVIIPALDEAPAIGKVLRALPPWVDDAIVVDNGSADGTGQAAEAAGARVILEARRGYGGACLAGMAALSGATDIVVFLDGDFSDAPDEMPRLVDPILDGDADFVLGERVSDPAGKRALTPAQRFGNALACRLIRLFWGHRYCDLGPFRAIRRRDLDRLGMQDRGFGWTVEMQIRAIEAGLRVREVPVPYRPRIGRSKISGTVSGAVRAGARILSVIFVSALRR